MIRGARGLGYNMAVATAEAGCRGIAIMDSNEDQGHQAAKELAQDAAMDVRFYKVDVTDEGAVGDAVEDISKHFGKIDVLISSAGIAK